MDVDMSQRFDALRTLAEALGLSDFVVTAQDVEHRVTSVDPSDLEFTDGDWGGSQARQSMPNPSDEDTDLSVLDQSFVFVPQGDEARDSKGNWVCPFRMEPGAPAHVSGLIACLAAINGARGGIKGIDDDVLRDGYEWVVDALVEAGHYDDADEAPDFEGSASDVDVDPDDATGDGGDGDGDGDGAEASDPDPDPDPDPDVDAPDPTTVELNAEAVGSVSVESDRDGSTLIEAQDGDALMGVVWAAGDHDLSLGGEGTPVRVPPETIPPTFEAAKDDVEAGEITLGFDHPGDDSVAAKTGIVEIGKARDIALTEDETAIVLTNSELTNDQAAEAAENGDFDDLDWSIVADVRIRRDDDGDPVTEDGRVVLDATRIRRIDAVTDGAVDAASIEREQSALPGLKSQVEIVQRAADDPNQANIEAAVDALRVSAAALQDHDMTDFDPDDYDDPAEALSAASDTIDDQQERIDALAGAFEDVIDAADGDDVDVDFDDVDVTDDPEAAAQAVIDAQTADLRADIARREARLAAYDTAEDDVDDRAQELAGRSASDLRARRNQLAYEEQQVEQEKQTRGAAAARSDSTGSSTATAGNDDEADELALSAMDGADRVNASQSDKSPADYLKEQYDVDASEFVGEDDAAARLREAVVQAATAEAGGD